jgi:hypothetical protein
MTAIDFNALMNFGRNFLDWFQNSKQVGSGCPFNFYEVYAGRGANAYKMRS